MAPRFCWKFYRPNVEGYRDFVDAVLSYEGDVKWIFGPSVRGLTCIVASKAEARSGAPTFVGYPPITAYDDSLLTSSNKLLWPTARFISQAIADLPRFVAHLETSLGLKTATPKQFDPLFVVSPEPPSSESIPPDFLEPGIHVTWIVQRDRERPSETVDKNKVTKNERRMLHFGVTEEELSLIYSNILGSLPSAGGPESQIPEFPMLSRIRGHDSVHFSESEIDTLKNECLRARGKSAIPLIIRGLDKIIMMCNWAKSLNGSIFLAGP